MSDSAHAALTIDQFTRQAIPFARLPGHSSSLDLFARLGRPGKTDDVLDVACGPGIVACYLAPLVGRVTGLDITPEMLRQAEDRQNEAGLQNLTWIEGSADPLPFAGGTFSLVVTRYSLHHFLNPAAVMAEMCRVCRPGGRLLVADVALPAGKDEAYDEIERLRDPSHVHALSREEFADQFTRAGLKELEFAEYTVDLALEDQLAASFPVEGGADAIRRIVRADVGVDRCGINARLEGEDLHYSVPIVIGTGVVA